MLAEHCSGEGVIVDAFVVGKIGGGSLVARFGTGEPKVLFLLDTPNTFTLYRKLE